MRRKVSKVDDEQRHLRCLQVNLHHCKAASDVVSRRFTKNLLDIIFIQEPWVNTGVIKGLNADQGRLIYNNHHNRPRAALFVRNNITCLPISEFIQGDLVAIWAKVPSLAGEKEVILASAYLPGDVDAAPTTEVLELVEYCRRRNLSWILCCDANAHHTTWGSTDINKRGEYLLEFICKNNINIANRGDEPTFRNAIRKEVLDLTLTSSDLTFAISNWHVSNELSMSDHQHLVFDIVSALESCQVFRNPRATNWDNFCYHLDNNIADNSKELLKSSREINYSATELGSNILNAYAESCQLKTRRVKRDVPWWNDGLDKLKQKARQLFNSAKLTGDWITYKAALTEYNKELRRSKRATWRTFCERITDFPEAVRLQKALSQDHTNGLCTLKRPDGSYTNSPEETCKLLLETHFPGCITTDRLPTVPRILSLTKRDIRLSENIFQEDRVKWALEKFSPFKSPGPDGIYPCLLQKGKDIIVPQLNRLFRSCLLCCHVPETWREVKVVFIPKAGKRGEQLPKSYRPISLSSFFLKTMEKLLDRHIRDTYLAGRPIHRLQFAYQQGKSTVTAIHYVVTTIEKAIQAKQIALCAFIDIQGAFDNTSYGAIENAMRRKQIPDIIINWTLEMLISRVITLNIGGSSGTINATRGCPQGGVLSPLLWTLVIDELLEELNNLGFTTYGYADDLVISISGWHEPTISERMQQALNITLRWCHDRGLDINPAKTILIPFTKRRNLAIIEPTLNGLKIPFSDEVKYLGVTLDKTLNWNRHLDTVTKKAIRASYACQRLFGKTWGLQPKMIYWSFNSIIKPIVTYAALAWWQKVEQSKAQDALRRIYRLACIGITGADRTCPTDAMGVMLNIPPLHISVKEDACMSALRLQEFGSMKSGDLKGHMKVAGQFLNDHGALLTDRMLPKQIFTRCFEVLIPERSAWSNHSWMPPSGSQIWFTDGSKQTNGDTGAGIYGPNFQRALPMGKYPSIFQAELYAILVCASECLRRRTKKAHIVILSDSQAALKALVAYDVVSRLVLDCISILNQLGKCNMLTLSWIPGHEGHEGNERADCLANRGARRPFIGPEPFCGTSTGYIREKLKTWRMEKFANDWNMSAGQRQAKLFISLSSRNSKRLLSLSKPDLRILTGYLTGHCNLRYHLRKKGLSDTDTCRFCELDTETSEHILCTCPSLYGKRIKFLGGSLISPKEIWDLMPSRIIGFIHSLNL